MAVKVMEEPPSRRVTRSALQNGLLDSPLPTPVKSTTRRSKPKKKVKFVEPSSDDKVKNTSLVSDEGIDMSFTPHLSLPQTISRPVHKMKQVNGLKLFIHSYVTQASCSNGLCGILQRIRRHPGTRTSTWSVPWPPSKIFGTAIIR